MDYRNLCIDPDEMIVDNFAGGGGASLGIGMALGRSPDIAINHDPEAIAMHRANHPETRHFCESVWAVDPDDACGGRRVGLAWFSPDCKHFSKAKGGKPVEKRIRGLAWVVIRWAKRVKPRVIILENVEEFRDWGPLTSDDKPCPRRRGMTFRRWKTTLQNLGYEVEWRELRACDYGAPTIRKRLFVVARCDGRPIAWPEPTHGNPKTIRHGLFDRDLRPWRTAAECIDWSLPCPSIFERSRPLAENTLRRIAAGIRRYVIDSPEPFIVNLTHRGGQRIEPIGEPLRTITGAHRGEKAICSTLVARIGQAAGNGSHVNDAREPLTTITSKAEHLVVSPFLAGVGGRAGQSPERSVGDPYQTITAKADAALVAPTLVQTGYGEREGQAPRSLDMGRPLGTVVGTAKHAMVAALLKHYGGVVGSDVLEPIGTVTAKDHHSLFAAHVLKLNGTCKDGHRADEPLATVLAQGTHLAEVRAFLLKYFGTNQDPRLSEPLHTVTSRDRFGLVVVRGEIYAIADIGLRMLTPRELFRAQGFPDEYVIAPQFGGKNLSKTAQVRMCGNSVSPPIAAAVAMAQFETTAGRATA